MGPPAFIEYTLGKLLSYCKGHEARAFTKGPAFADHPTPTLELTCPECGPSGSPLQLHHSQVGPDAAHRDRFPHLTWTPVTGAREYLLLCEDVDLPIPGVVVFHGLFYGLPPARAEVTAEDVEPVDNDDSNKEGGKSAVGVTKGGFKYVRNIQGSHYGGPKPVMGHGVHRYYYQLVALREPVDTGKMGKVTKDGLGRAIVGKVIRWGQWIGTYERKWE